MKISSQHLEGTIVVPASKSLSHRAIIAASLAKGKSAIHNLSFSEDIEASIEAMRELGAQISKKGSSLLVFPFEERNKDSYEIHCRESASTLRFLIPLSLVQERKVRFWGRGKLPQRPLDLYFPIFQQNGISYQKASKEETNLCLSVEGQLKAGLYSIPGNVSSQFITGLLFTLPLLKGDSELLITEELESKAYIDLTLQILESFGIEILALSDSHYQIRGGQEYQATNIDIEGDYSQAAFFLVANSLGAKIHLENLKQESKQGDRAILDCISLLEAKQEEEILEMDGSQFPDIIPILSLRAALSPGKTILSNLSRLTIKESNRLEATADILQKLGAKIQILGDALHIEGVKSLYGNKVSSYGDHRLAMMIAIASMRTKGEISIDDMDCVKKSYPHFWEDFKALGGKIYVG